MKQQTKERELELEAVFEDLLKNVPIEYQPPFTPLLLKFREIIKQEKEKPNKFDKNVLKALRINSLTSYIVLSMFSKELDSLATFDEAAEFMKKDLPDVLKIVFAEK